MALLQRSLRRLLRPVPRSWVGARVRGPVPRFGGHAISSWKIDAIFTAPGQGASGTGKVSPGLSNWPPPGSHFGYQFWYPKWEHGGGFPWKYKQSAVCPGPKTGPQNGNMELRKRTASWTPGRHHFSCRDPGAPGRPHDLKGRHIIFKWLGFFRHKSKQGQRAV